jgi:branched-chain amino acid transport system ATP-binding protein
MHKATLIILGEHRSLAAVLHGLQHVVRDIVNRGASPDFRLLEAMVAYIEEFPEVCHHPKEDAHLFPLLRRRVPEAAPTLDDLEAQHREGQGRLAHLKQALVHYRACMEAPASLEDGTASFRKWGNVRRLVNAAALLESVESYAAFHWKHMRIEEDIVLRLAEKHLDATDWAGIEAAFSANRDPLRGVGADGQDFRALFTRIVNLAPAPIGLGPARDAA